MRGRKPNPIKIELAAGDPRKKDMRKLREAASIEKRVLSGLPDPPVDDTSYQEHQLAKPVALQDALPSATSETESRPTDNAHLYLSKNGRDLRHCEDKSVVLKPLCLCGRMLPISLQLGKNESGVSQPL